MQRVKKELGFLIEYYRQKAYAKTNSKEYAKETFPTKIIQHQQISICSATTYRKICHGELVKNDTIYDLLLEKLQLCYDETSYVYTKQFQVDCHSLQVIQERMEDALAYTLCDEILSHLQGKDVLEQEYRIVFEALKEMYTKNKMVLTIVQMQPIADKFAVYNDDIKQCLEIMVYNYCVMAHLDQQILYYYAMISNTPYHRVHFLYYCIDDGYHLDLVKEEMQALLDHYEKAKNHRQVFNLLNMKMKYYYRIGRDSDEAVKETDAYLEQHREAITDSLIYSYMYFKAKKYCREKDFKKAKEQIEILLENDRSHITYVSSYYFYCLIMLDTYTSYHKEYEAYLEANEQIMYRYFALDRSDYKAREQYIIQVLCHQNILQQEFDKASFLSELRKLVKLTKHYALLEKYLEKTDESM